MEKFSDSEETSMTLFLLLLLLFSLLLDFCCCCFGFFSYLLWINMKLLAFEVLCFKSFPSTCILFDNLRNFFCIYRINLSHKV